MAGYTSTRSPHHHAFAGIFGDSMLLAGSGASLGEDALRGRPRRPPLDLVPLGDSADLGDAAADAEIDN